MHIKTLQQTLYLELYEQKPADQNLIFRVREIINWIHMISKAHPPAPRVSIETQSLHESQQGIMLKLKIAGDLNFELMEP